MSSPALDEPLLEVSGARKVYGGEVALADASLNVAAGSIHGLVGANGAGKSTLVRIISGVESQDAGTISIAGEELPVPHSAAAAREAGVAHIDQDRALVAAHSIAENVALTVGYPTRRGLISVRRMREQARAALDAVGLAHDVDAPAGELPISDQTMVAIARALATEARLVLLDEPTANLGAEEASWLLGRLRDLAGRGIGCVLITHALGEALEVADAITVLRDGQVVATKPTGALDERALAGLMIGHQVRAAAEDRCDAAREALACSGAGDQALAADLDHVREPPSAATEARPPRLELDGIRYERLGPLSLSLRPGEIVALTGLADAGHLLAGEALIGRGVLEAGSMRLDGDPFEPDGVAAARRMGVACVPADRIGEGLALELTARENLFLDGSECSSPLRGIGTGEERATARSILARGQVTPADPEAVLSTLSGGNMQKVLIAKWLAARPRVLVLCEPTVGVDVGAREEIYAQLREACVGGLAVLLASSDFEEVTELADRALVLRYGVAVGEIAGGEASVERLSSLSGGGRDAGVQAA